METVELPDAPLAYERLGEGTGQQIIWAHGWMNSHGALVPLARSLERQYAHFLVDFPGFGVSPLPPVPWGTADYADHAAQWLKTLPEGRRIWVGHSFGCRVGIQLAARHPGLVDGLFLISAAGLPRQLSLGKKIGRRSRVYTFKLLKRLLPFESGREWLRQKFGSRDYREAGALRPIFVKVVSENLTGPAERIQCPVHLVYGERDTETPPEIGQRFARIIPNASFSLLPTYDHYSILAEGRYQVLHQLKEFMEKIPG